ncbi:hypothetical protein [Shivajiella indica]|uniref:Neutral/alkaline non-lysosomal ceramidase N-terminal domain-containing protein n=1 Tax=Shivajiella indica TaxID=872115 RepID=A0ABW5B8F9_9BACT
MKKWLKVSIGFFLFLLILFLAFTFYQFRDRHKGYDLAISYKSQVSSSINSGFGKVDISPLGFDTWNDANGDARFQEKDGDTYNDLNGNGKFDPIWLAGFHQNRPASDINDPLWARTMVLDNGDFRLAICVIDMISFGNDEVISVRKRLDPSLEIDYLIISSTHVHSSPDLMGMYGPNEFTNGVNKDYLEFVKKGILQSVENAVKHLEPAYFRFGKEDHAALSLVGDTRDPQVLDAGLNFMQVLSVKEDRTLGIILNWGNHPETLWSRNTIISSDFPHFYRKYVEEGIMRGDSIVMEGIGGTAIFMNGALGGLMTTHPSIPIYHPYSQEAYQEPGIAKIDAQGMSLAKITLEKLKSDDIIDIDNADFGLSARSIELSLDNTLFRLGAWMGIFDRGFVRWGKIRSEVSAWRLGPASFVHVPGELYPEILNGGIENPDGADFKMEPVEFPAIRTQMTGSYKFFNGMSNDMIGYIVPKSQWDEKAPFSYGRTERPYGEINSLGPETAPAIHGEVMKILKDLNNDIEKK